MSSGITVADENDLKAAESILDANEGYVAFCGDYAVVDGHYKLHELEALLVVARKELKHAE